MLGSPPPELEALLERRRRAGVDRLDEVWEGVLHTVAAATLVDLGPAELAERIDWP